jgi:hypothetical protein
MKAARRWVPWIAAYTGARANEIPLNAKGEKIRDGGLWCVYEFTWQMDAIMFWDKFEGRWLRGWFRGDLESPVRAIRVGPSWVGKSPSLFGKLRHFGSALRALIYYLVPATKHSRLDRFDCHRARRLALRTMHQRVEVGVYLVGLSRTVSAHGRLQSKAC